VTSPGSRKPVFYRYQSSAYFAYIYNAVHNSKSPFPWLCYCKIFDHVIKVSWAKQCNAE